jgi:hypothetical protein
MHVYTGSSIFRRAVLSFTTMTKYTGSCESISSTGLRLLAG